MSRNLHIFFTILVLLILAYKNSYSLENKVLFKINDKSFTTYDKDTRLKYLKFVGENDNLDNETVIKDYISALIFNEYYISLGNKINLNNKVNEVYENILKTKTNDEILEFNINKQTISKNLRLDLIRKNIIEQFLNEKRNDIFTKDEEEDLLYNYNLSYISINKNDLYNSEDFDDLLKKENLDEINLILDNKNINYLFKKEVINNLNSISKEIRDNALFNNNFFFINDENIITFFQINKFFETQDNLDVEILTFNSNSKIEDDILNCDKIINSEIYNKNIILKRYEYNKLNKKVKENLISINDKIEIINDEFITYILLCEIIINKETLNNININKKINSTVSNFEKEFIKQYSKEYNLIYINE